MHLSRLWKSCLLALLFLIGSFLQSTVSAQSGSQTNSSPFDVKVFDRLEWRSIGPANMGGRTADVEGVPGNPKIVYAATASGGLWKTTNGGTTWKPIFERQGTISIGDIALEPNNPDVIWVGTGESNMRNTVSFGDGIYKSTDGGSTWKHMGLKETEHISAIAINPRNPDNVYVAAIGHAFGPNEERGVFMTTDGGKTWQKTLYIDEHHGACDLDIDPNNPNVLFAGMWNFERKPWTFTSGSEKGGLFKSIDGGRTWKKIANDLPKLLGRIGVRVAPSNSQVVYAIVESKEGSLYRSDDGGESFRQVSNNRQIVSRGFYYTRVRIDPTNENKVYAVASTLFVSIDGGRNFRSITNGTHIDYHALWIDPQDPGRMWQGQDGGIAVSYDGGGTWDYVNNIPIGQLYMVWADNQLPFYNVMGGMQDNGTWTGPSRSKEPAGIMNDDWRMVNFGDGFFIYNHPDNPNLYLSESQGGNIVRTDMSTREQQQIRPDVRLGGGPASALKFRFNWNAPFIISPHEKNTVYIGGNVVFKSADYGQTWRKISGDLTTDDEEKQKDAGGPVSTENTSAEYYSTIISLAESPLKRGTIWAGSDDGNLQVTTDDGKSWTNIVKNVSGLAAHSPVSHIELSRRDAAVAYVAFERHMFDDFRPYIFKTSDGGKTWSNISGDLPGHAYVQVVREDPKNPNLLYAGTETGLYASYTGGNHWVELGLKNFPRVSVHDILVHPRENDLILATHGRSFWIFDDATPIQQMNAEIEKSDAYLFDVRRAIRHTERFTRYGTAEAVFFGPNPPYGALISYYLKDKPNEKTKVKIQVLDQSGKVIREIDKAPAEKGLNRMAWDLNTDAPKSRGAASGGGGSGIFGGGGGGPEVVPGKYSVKLMVGDKTIEKSVEVILDPTVKAQSTDLQAQFDAEIKLRDMLSTTNQVLASLDALKDQLEQIQKTVKSQMTNPPEELTKGITDAIKQIDEQASKLARPRGAGFDFGGGARLAEKLGGLMGGIGGVNAKPTAVQMEAFGELQKDFGEKVPAAIKFIKESVPKWNELLKKHDAPIVLPGKPIDMPR